MTGHPLRRPLVVATVAVLLASLTATAVAAPASAAKPKCRGQVATIVGTKQPDRIVGTNKRDVIVARGGNDIVIGRGGNDLICGGPGADRLVGKAGIDLLFGNAGPDRLFGGNGPDRLLGGTGDDVLAGQVGRDLLNGGPGTDTCYQGQGAGPQASCELPPPAAPIVQAPAPPPADTDGDGIPDDADACPDKGDRGWGVDGTGCPSPPLGLSYAAANPSLWTATATWSGLEPGSPLWLEWYWSGGMTMTVILTGLNARGGNSTEIGPAQCENGGPLLSATLHATEAGSTEQLYPMPLPDDPICP